MLSLADVPDGERVRKYGESIESDPTTLHITSKPKSFPSDTGITIRIETDIPDKV